MRAYTGCVAVALQLAVGAHDAHALDGQRGIGQYAQTHFDARDGLSQNLATAIAQTADGYLWVSSEEGLSRFDGVRFTNFGHGNTEGLPTSVYNVLTVDSSGTLWAGTRDHGLVHLVDGEFRPVVWAPEARTARINALTFDHDGDLWVGLNDRGLVRLHSGALATALTSRDGLPSNGVRSLLATRDGTLWIGTMLGLASWKTGHVNRGPAALDGIEISALVEDARGDLWCATPKGLAHLHGNTLEWVGVDRLPSTGIVQLLFDREGNLWIGSYKGVARLTPSGQIDLLPRPVAMVLALLEDSEGNLWIGTEGGGLDRVRDGDVVPFGAAQGATDKLTWAVREDPTGAIWIASYEGLFRIPPGQTTATKIVSDHETILAIYPDTRGDVWFSARDGTIGRWHDGQVAWLGRGSFKSVRSIAETKEGMWLGTDNGLFRFHDDGVQDAESVLPGFWVTAIMPDVDGGLWLATARGVMRWSAGALVPIPAGGPPTSTPATTIQLDPDGTLWVGTEGVGLWRLRRDRWFAFTSKIGMFDDRVWSAFDDGGGRLWMSSNRGIWSVSRQQLDDLAAGLRATVDSTVYGEADGMRDRECNGSIDPPGWRAHDGRIWIPTVKGVAVIDPAHLSPTRPANAVIESVRVDGQPHPHGPMLELAPGSNRLEIDYTAPAVGRGERLRFRYRLDGFEPTWNDARGQRLAQYTNLAPGGYRFIVEAGSDGVWGHAATIAITLRPHYYQTRWFAALAIATIVLAIVAVPLLRMRRLRARARELDERVQSALRELRATQAQLVEASRLAGRSDVATAVLHNVGNVLNSLNVSASLVKETITNSKANFLSNVAAMITEHRGDLAGFLRDDRRGQKLPDYFTQLPVVLEKERAVALTELESLMQNVEQIKTIVASQQVHVNRDVNEIVDVHAMLEDAIKFGAASCQQDAISVVRRFDVLPTARFDRHKVLQILINLLANAHDAVMTKPAQERRITVTARNGAPGTLEIIIEDNGCGIAPEHLTRIFQLGYTTKADGRGGLGLHYSACAARELHGNLTASSPGIGSGASFLLVLPVEPHAA